jgi:hypothetical protein
VTTANMTLPPVATAAPEVPLPPARRATTAPDARPGVADNAELAPRADRDVRTTLDTSGDPTGAAILGPLVMLGFYGLAGVGFVLAR